MRVLHILRSPEDERALTTARAHARAHETNLLLLDDAATAKPPDFPGIVYICVEDGSSPGDANLARTVGYDEVIFLLFDHDRVIAW